MHLAMSAGIGNDPMAELVIVLILWQSLRIVRTGLTLQRGVTVGVLLGLALLTKTTIYLGAVVVATALLLERTPGGSNPIRNPAQWVRRLAGIAALALLFGTPWFLRNVQVYGDWDVLAWQRHDAVVSAQLRTADLLSEVGVAGLLQRFAATTFRSFWAQFGWMGVLVDERIYSALGLLSALLALGLVLFALRAGGSWLERSSGYGTGHPEVSDCRALAVMGMSGLLTLLLYLGYNLKFVQHQGRYLFTALASLALGAALGLRELLMPRTARVLALALMILTVILVVSGAVGGDVPGWTIGLLVASMAWLAGAGWLPQRWRWIFPASLYAGLLSLDLISLYGYIVPALQWSPA
jgi:hypothetical protein